MVTGHQDDRKEPGHFDRVLKYNDVQLREFYVATKLHAARLPGVSLTDTSRLNTNPSNIRIYSTEERSKDRSSVIYDLDIFNRAAARLG